MNPIKRLPAPHASPSAQGKPGRRFGFNIGFNIALSILLLVTGAGWGQGSGWKWLTGGNLKKVKFIGQQGWIYGDDGNQGIILHTTNGGDTWAIQPHNTGRHYFNGLCFVDSTNGWIVGGWLGMGEPGFILRTRNGGRTWREEYTTNAYYLRGIAYVDILYGWFTTNIDTIYRTTNGGITWQGIQPDTNRWAFGPIDFVDTLKGYAVLPGGIFMVTRTTDGGLTWTTVSDAFLPYLLAIDMVDSVKGSASGEGDVMVRTQDGWRTWQTTTGGPYVILYDISFGDTLDGWAVGGDNGHNAMIFNTTDGRVTWSWDSTLTTNNAFYGVDAANTNTAYVAGAAGSIVKTTNSGNTWTVKRNADIKNFSLYNVSFYNANLGWSTGSNGVITHTTNGGAVWQRQVSGTFNFIFGVTSPSPQKGWVCSDGAEILTTTNSGNTWSFQTSNTTYPLFSIDFADTLFGVAVGGGYGPAPLDTLVMPDTSNPSLGKAKPWSRIERMKEKGSPTTAYRTITRTTNGGATWIAQNTNASPLYGVKFITRSHGWACGDGGTVLHTTDLGATWQSQNTGVTNGLYWITFQDPLHGWACGSGGRILWTTDGGNTWNTGASGVTQYLNSIAFADTLTGFAVSDNGLIIRSTDGGRNWVPDTSKCYANLPAVFALDSTHVWTVGSFGMVLGWGEAGQTGMEQGSTGEGGQGRKETALGQSYPNPTRGIASFEYELGKAEKVRVRVYNVAGQLVRTLVDSGEPVGGPDKQHRDLRFASTGRHIVTWDGKDSSGKNVRSGTYFYCLEAGDRKAVRKMVVIK